MMLYTKLFATALVLSAVKVIILCTFVFVPLTCHSKANQDQIIVDSPPARVTATLTDKVDHDGMHLWAWPISTDESRRLTDMLGQDFDAVNIGGTYVTTPMTQCKKCGKDHEFIDW